MPRTDGLALERVLVVGRPLRGLLAKLLALETLRAAQAVCAECEVCEPCLQFALAVGATGI